MQPSPKSRNSGRGCMKRGWEIINSIRHDVLGLRQEIDRKPQTCLGRTKTIIGRGEECSGDEVLKVVSDLLMEPLQKSHLGVRHGNNCALAVTEHEARRLDHRQKVVEAEEVIF